MYSKSIQRVEEKVKGWRGWLMSENARRQSDMVAEDMVDAQVCHVHIIDAWDLNGFLL